MIIFFPSQVLQPRSQEITVTIPVTKQTTISIVNSGQGCSLRLNEETTDKTNVIAEAGEEVSLIFTSKSGYADKDTFEFDVNGERAYFVYCTEDDPAKTFDPYYRGKSFLDTVSANDGSAITYTNDNTLEFFAEDGTQISISLDVFAAPDAVLSDNQTYMLDNRSGKIYKIDVDNQIAVKELSLGSPAVGMSVARKPGSSEKVTWLTLNNGRVVCIDSEENIVKELAINGVGTGIDTSVDGRLVVVCDTGANLVHIYENMGGDNWHSSMLPSSGYPYDVFVDAQKNIWVTSKLGAKLMVFPFGSRLPIEIDVGKGQKTVKQINDRTVGVVCTETNEIVMLDARTKSVKERISVDYPVDIAVIDKTVYIANAKSEVLKMELVGSALSAPIEPYLDAMPTIYSLDSDKESKSLIIAKMYGNTPNMLAVPNRLISFIAFEGPPQVFNTKDYVSDTVFAKGITASVQAYTPVGLDARLVVLTDGLNSGATVSADSKVKFEFLPTGIDKEKIIFPILIGNFLTYFESTLKITTADLKPFRFYNVMLTNLDSVYESNAVKIAGLLEEQLSEFTVDKSHSSMEVFINGIMAEAPYLVKNDDVISLSAKFIPSDFENPAKSLFLRASCEDFTANWQILLVDLVNGEVVTKPYTSGLPLQSLNWNLGSWGEITVYDKFLNEINRIGLWPDDITENTIVDTANEILVPDYRNKRVFAIDSTNDTAAKSSEILDSGPYNIIRINNDIFVSLPDTGTILKLDSDLQIIDSKNLIYAPYGLAENNGKLAVASGDAGKVYFYNPQTLELSGDPVLINGSVIDLVQNGQDLWVSDFTNGKIKVVQNDLIHKSYEVGGNPTSFSIDAARRIALVVNNYDNSVTEINLDTDELTTTELGRPVHAVTSFEGKWQLIDMQTTSLVENFNTVDVENDENLYVKKTLKQNSGLLLNSTQDKLYVLHLASEYLNILEERVYASSDSFIPQLSVSVRGPVISNHVTMNYMSRPQSISVIPDMGYSLILNSVPVSNTAMVYTGDTVAIVASTPRHFAAMQEIILSGKGYAEPFAFQTVPNYIPDFIKFETIFGAMPGEQVTSNEAVISGLSYDIPVSIHCEDRFVVVYINGVIVKSLGSAGLVLVKNGDLIKLQWEVELNTNAIATQKNLIATIPNVSFASWNIYQIALSNIADLGLFINWSILRYARGEAIFEIQNNIFIDGMTAESSNAKISEYFNVGSYLSNSLTLFAKSFSIADVNISNIHTASPYLGYLLTLNNCVYSSLSGIVVTTDKRFYSDLTYHHTSPKSYFGAFDGSTFIAPKSYFGAFDGSTFIAPKSYFCTNEGFQEFKPQIYFGYFDGFYSVDLSHYDFKSEKYTTPPLKVEYIVNAFTNDFSQLSHPFYSSANSYSINWFDKIFEYESHTVIDVDYLFEFYTNAINDYSTEIFFSERDIVNYDYFIEFSNHTPENFDYEFSFYTTVYGDFTEDIVNTFNESTDRHSQTFEVEFLDDNQKTNGTSMIMLAYKATEVMDVAYDFSVSISPDPIQLTREFPWFPSHYYSKRTETIVNATPDSFYSNLEADAITTISYYGKLVPANYAGVILASPRYSPTVLDITPTYQIIKDTLGFERQQSNTRIEVVGISTFVMQVELVEKIDQTDITPSNKGSYDEPNVETFISNTEDFEANFLSKYQLIDGTWMYYHLNRLPYGECVLYDYIVTHGLVRGG